MMLFIDAGNTLIKWAWQPPDPSQSADWVVHRVTHDAWICQAAAAQPLRAALTQASACVISNVAGEAWLDAMPATVSRQRCHLVQSPAAAYGLVNGYQVPAQLGSDRWCTLLAAWQQWQQSALVVSVGTAVTLDFLEKTATGHARFHGGSIQPGLRLMWQSLQQGTAQLAAHDWSAQLASQAIDSPTWPTNTQQALWQGCVGAISAAISRRYEALCLSDPETRLILTGGDAAWIQAVLPESCTVRANIEEHLVLKGLAWMAHL